MTKNAFVFIDGSNFYFKLKELTRRLTGKHTLLGFNFRKFSEWLAGGDTLAEAHYYVGRSERKS